MKLRRILASLFVFCMFAAMTVSADEAPIQQTLIGTFVSYENNQMTILCGDDECVIQMDKNTCILSSSDALPIEPERIEAGTPITFVCRDAMTMEYMSQVYGYVIMVGENAPLYGTVAEATETETGFDYSTIYDDYIFRTSEETEITSFLTKNILRAEDITPGTELLVYADLMTTSRPAQVSAPKIVALPPDAEINTNDEIDMSKMNVNGREIALNILAETNADGEEVLMLPVRAVLEAMGWTVSWDGNSQTVASSGIEFKIGEDSYTKRRLPSVALGVAPVLVPEGEDSEFALTYVPLSLFTDVFFAEAHISNGMLTLLDY